MICQKDPIQERIREAAQLAMARAQMFGLSYSPIPFPILKGSGWFIRVARLIMAGLIGRSSKTYYN